MKDTDRYRFSLKKYGFPPRNCGVSVFGSSFFSITKVSNVNRVTRGWDGVKFPETVLPNTLMTPRVLVLNDGWCSE